MSIGCQLLIFISNINFRDNCQLDFIQKKKLILMESPEKTPASSSLDKKDLEAITPSTTPFETGEGEFQQEIESVKKTTDVKLGQVP